MSENKIGKTTYTLNQVSLTLMAENKEGTQVGEKEVEHTTGLTDCANSSSCHSCIT